MDTKEVLLIGLFWELRPWQFFDILTLQIVSLGLLSCWDLNFVMKHFTLIYFNLFQSGKMGGSARVLSIYDTLFMGRGWERVTDSLPVISNVHWTVAKETSSFSLFHPCPGGAHEHPLNCLPFNSQEMTGEEPERGVGRQWQCRECKKYLLSHQWS